MSPVNIDSTDMLIIAWLTLEKCFGCPRGTCVCGKGCSRTGSKGISSHHDGELVCGLSVDEINDRIAVRFHQLNPLYPKCFSCFIIGPYYARSQCPLAIQVGIHSKICFLIPFVK